MRGEVLYVLSDNRSGSTLLDQLLGAHSDVVSLGEVHWLAAYVRQDRRLYDPAFELICSCGAPVPECPFWRQVEVVLGRPLDSLRLQPRYFAWTGAAATGRADRRRIGRFPKRFLERAPSRFRQAWVQRLYGGPRVAGDSLALYDAIFQVTGSHLLVDSSKHPFRFRAIHDRHPARVRAVLLARDYRAVVHSKMKRGRSLEESTLGWRERMIQVEALTADIPSNRKFRLRYEDLCADPRAELTRLCDFLGLEFTPAMLSRPSQGVHHLGGSPSKLDATRTAISLDRSHESAFKPEHLDRMRVLAGDIAAAWGY